MKKTILALAASFSALVSFASIRALTHDMYGGNTKTWQLHRHAQKVDLAKKGGAKIVFIGDFITH